MPPDRYITTGAAAREIGVSQATLSRWAAQGTVIPADRTLGGHYRWHLPSLRAQLRLLRPPENADTAAEDIASIIHDANRRLQIIQGDPWPSPLWDEAPAYQARESALSVRAALNDPGRTPEQNHQGWLDRLTADGWAYGAVKDAAARTHPLLLPYSRLPEEARQKDRLFIAIVRALAPAR